IGVIGNIYFSWQSTDTETLYTLQDRSPIYLVFALLLLLLMWIFNATRLYIWGRFLDVNPPFWKLFRISVATDLGSAVTPTLVGGAPIKVGMLTQTGFRLGVATTLIALNGIEDICFFVLIIPISLTLTDSWNSPVLLELYNSVQQYLPRIATYVVVSLIVLLLLNAMLRHFSSFRLPKWHLGQRISDKLQQIRKDFGAVFKLIGERGWWVFALSVLATCGQWLSRFAILITVVLALDINEHLLELFSLQWMVYLSMSFVPTPGATGGAEVIFYYVFQSLLPEQWIGVVVASWRFLTYYLMMLMALLLLQFLGKRQQNKNNYNSV
ncbi:MAG: lysylphosphatidylglycerol synthase transmembrane domain-containing protein, partial [Bacteroidota bacterium]